MRKHPAAVLAGSILFLMLCLAGCAKTGTGNAGNGTAVLEAPEGPAAADSAAGTEIIEKTIECEGLKEPVRLVFISDLHLIAAEDLSGGTAAAGLFAVDPASQETVDQRYRFFMRDGMSPEEYWPQLAAEADALEADAVLLGADMLDFCTPEAIGALTDGISRIRTPLMYVRADHDTGLWYCGGGAGEEDASALQDTVADNRDIMVLELPGLKVIGINNSTSQISADALFWLGHELSVCREEKMPAVILTHVPFRPEKDTGLAAASEKAWDGRRLYWGADASHVPDSNTAELLELLYAEDSPVIAVLAGHLHFGYEGELADNAVHTMQYVCEPAFAHRITVFTIQGKKD